MNFKRSQTTTAATSSLWSHFDGSLFAFFGLCRLTILLFYDAYVTDVAFYLEIAKQGLTTGAKAYQDFPFGYPPLALFFVYLPGIFSNLDFWDYWRIFRAQMFFVDLGLFSTCYFLLKKRFQIGEEKLTIFVVSYALLGFLQGHLLYDRLDLLIVASLLGVFFLHTTKSMSSWWIRGISTMGMLVKFVPFLLALVLNLLARSPAPSAAPFSKERWFSLIYRGLRELILLLLPFFLFAGLYETIVAKNLLVDLKMHLARGIQVESTWATPLIVGHLIQHPGESFAVSNFGAQHIDEQKVPSWYVMSSKIGGIVILGLFFIYLFFHLVPKLQKNKTPLTSPTLAGLVWLIIFCLFLATQRVLSPQFFIWLMIPISFLLAFDFDRSLAVLAVLNYGLTYLGFDVGYWKFVEGHPLFVSIVALRNLSLLALTAYALWKLSRLGIQNPEAERSKK